MRCEALRLGGVAVALSGLAFVAAAPRRPSVETDWLRPRFHFTPRANFMNDPNGLSFYQGEYHLFYQHNPFGPRWGHMSWGHAVSDDAVRWRDLPVALREERGVMVFSGSVVVDEKNASGFCAAGGSCLVAVYTGFTGKKQHQNIAYSNDRGRTWTKYARNPIIDLGLADFRDPKVFWHAPTRRFVMATVLSDVRKVRFFGSTDLKHWTTLSDFGPAGAQAGLWECPDLFSAPVEGAPSERRFVLVVSVNDGAPAGGTGTQYFVGSFDGERFSADDAATRWVDYGKDFYAAQSISGIGADRPVWIGWLSNWLYAQDEPTSPWRGAQSIPRTLALKKNGEGWALTQTPVEALVRLRGDSSSLDRRPTPLPLSAEIALTLRKSAWESVALRLSNALGEVVHVGVSMQPAEVFVDRRASRRAPFGKHYAERHAAPLEWSGDTLTLRVFFDRSTIEVFAGEGTRTISDRVFPTRALDRVEVIGDGAALATAQMWPLTQAIER